MPLTSWVDWWSGEWCKGSSGSSRIVVGMIGAEEGVGVSKCGAFG